ncbi:MAG: DegV family protein [bacterium]|nr:DegV family protein [bacterium]
MVKIIADSTCDLSKELIERYDVSILPLHILLGEEEHKDGVDITPEKIYQWSDANLTTPKTSAVALEDALAVMGPIVENGDEIVAFCISEQMSTTCNIFRLAAQELYAESSIDVIDSKSLSTGIGLLVIEAAIMAGEGASKQDIVTSINQMREDVRASFVVDTLTYLYRGGRCSSVAALAGSVLKLHPKIEVKNGAMEAGKKYRGKLCRVILDYVKDMEEELIHSKKDRVFITHSGCDPAIVEEVRQYLEELGYFKEILITRAGGVVSSHCGPGTLGVLCLK